MPNSLPISKFLSGVVLVVAASILFGGSAARGADANAESAGKRATLYQTEARGLFAHDRWTIAHQGANGFTAVHEARPGGPTSAQASHKLAGLLMVHVAVTFTPKDAGSTDCAVKIEAFLYSRKGKDEKYTLSGPFKADYPENSNYVRDLLIKAEDRLGAKYPRYRAN